VFSALARARIAKPEELFDDPHLAAGGGLLPLTVPDGIRKGGGASSHRSPKSWDAAGAPITRAWWPIEHRRGPKSTSWAASARAGAGPRRAVPSPLIPAGRKIPLTWLARSNLRPASMPSGKVSSTSSPLFSVAHCWARCAAQLHRWPYGSLLQISLRLGSPTPQSDEARSSSKASSVEAVGVDGGNLERLGSLGSGAANGVATDSTGRYWQGPQ
jgi:hypothetical protein